MTEEIDHYTKKLIATTEIKPCLQLQPFVRCFIYREMWMSEKTSRPLFATPDFILSFNLSDKKFGFIAVGEDGSQKTETVMDSSFVITGVGTQFTGIMTGNGFARIFSIYFTPVGFFHVFGIPASHFTNIIQEAAYSVDRNFETLRDQFMESKNLSEMVNYCQMFLTKRLNKNNIERPYDSISVISGLIQADSNLPMEKLAHEANMSMKTFERRFAEQVGCSAKVFSRILRFNKAIGLKMCNAKRSWTDIAHTCGYYDQAHFVKDFRLFSGSAPTNFFNDTPPLVENFTDQQNDKVGSEEGV